MALSLPQDIQCEAYDYPEHFFESRTWRIERRPPDPQRIAEAVLLLKNAKRPVIIAGGGVIYSNAFDELKAFSDQCGIPVGETTAGRGALDGDTPMNMGGQGIQGTELAAKIMSQADLVFCVGTRLSDFTTASRSLFQHPEVKFININVGGCDAFKMGGLPVVADAKLALQELTGSARQAKISTDENYRQEVAQTKEKWQVTIDEGVRNFDDEAIGDGQLLRVLFEESQPGDAAVGASSSLLSNICKLWQPTRDRPCFLEYGYSCMGYEIPAAIGTRMARPEGEVYALVGDGTYLMHPTELVTAVQEGLKITALISVNHGYQCILAHQRGKVGHDFGNEFRHRNPKSNCLDDGDAALLSHSPITRLSAEITFGPGSKTSAVELGTLITDDMSGFDPCGGHGAV